jgi:hypothetical protein
VPSEQVTRAAPALYTPYRRRLELAPALFLGAVDLDPIGQRRPRPDHDLVREIDTRLTAAIVLARDEQAIGDQSPDHEVEAGDIVIGSLKP